MACRFDLSGNTAIVTGSSRGIGRAIAEAFAEQGANVAVTSRTQQKCDEVAAAINARGRGKAIAVAANIGSSAELADLTSRTRAAFGDISILVCNAASNPYFGPMANIADAQFEKVLRNNILANHWLAQLVAPDMRRRREGSIIFISSISGLRGSKKTGAYGISKAADLQLARNLAVELGPDEVRVNCITPGLIQTDFSRALWSDARNLQDALQGVALQRLGQAEDIAGAAVFLASRASGYVTGQSIIVDGGATVTASGI
jgi:NAD(P)-dependent dehydrogenase (short-subunit alcohol dehydrogenase family)